jgi:hypothetical protein
VDFFSVLNYLIFFMVLEVHSDIYKTSYKISSRSFLNAPIRYSPLSSPPPIPGIVSTCIIFYFIYMCTQCLHYFHAPIPLSPHSPHFHLVPIPRQDLFTLQFSDFVKGQKDIFIYLR